MELSVIIPVYNEEKRIIATVNAAVAFFKEHEPDHEIILVNDGSRDTTASIIDGFAKAHPEIKVISYDHNRGKGFAILTGLQNAKGDFVLTMDADLSTPLKEYLKLKDVLLSNKLDLVIGSRVKEESDIEVKQPLYRRFVGRAFNLLVRIIALPHIKDSQCGFKLYTRKAYTLIASQQTIHNFSFDVEHLFIARKAGLSFKEVGVKWSNDRNTTVSVFRSAVPMFFDLFRIRWRHK